MGVVAKGTGARHEAHVETVVEIVLLRGFRELAIHDRSKGLQM